MSRYISVIINPASGKREAILTPLNEVCTNYNIDYDVHITKKEHDGYSIVKKILRQKIKPDSIVVYGGDGTVMEVAQALIGSKISLVILPGGTANIVAKDLNIPMNTEEAMTSLLAPKAKKSYIDMGKVNNKYFIGNIGIGIFADMITETEKSQKSILGPSAYALTCLGLLRNYPQSVYKIILDGKKFTHTGIGMIISNAGNIGIPGVSISPNTSIIDGKLDLLIAQEAEISTMVDMLRSSVFQQSFLNSVTTYQGKVIHISISPPQNILWDDKPMDYKPLKISVVPKAISVVT